MKIALPVFDGDTRLSINSAYVNYIHSAGFEPILVTGVNNIQDMTALCDGLLLPGGIDIEPTFYGEDNFGSEGCDPEKDDFERKVFHSFIAAGKKVFGICRGHQLIVKEFLHEFINKCDGLSFWQHINNHSLAQNRSAKRSTPTHSVTVNPRILYGLMEAPKLSNIFVNSMHHQALLADGAKNLTKIIDDNNYLKCIAVTNFGSPATKENDWLVIEGVEVKLHGVLLRSVQWHPEELMDVGLLTQYFAGVAANADRVKLYR